MQYKNIQYSTYLLILTILVISSQFAISSTNNEKLKLAEAFEKSGDMKSASRLYYELYQSEHLNEKYYEAVIRTFKAQNMFQELLPIIEENLKVRENSSVFSLYAEILWKLGKIKEANKAWEDATELNPENERSYTDVANSQITCRLYDKAISTLLKGRDKLRILNFYADELAQLYTMTGNYKSATGEILNLFESTRNISIAQGRISSLLSNKESKDFIFQTLSDRAKSSHDPEYKKLYGWLLRNFKKYDEALEQYKLADDILKTQGFEVLNFATASQKDGEYDVAIKAYEFLIDKGKKSPYLLNALFGYARTLENKFQNKNTIETSEIIKIVDRYRSIVKEYPNTPTAEECLFRIALLYTNQIQDYKSAIKTLNDLITKTPNRPVTAMAMNLLGDIYFYSDDFKESARQYKKIQDYFKSLAPNEYLAAQYKLAELEYFTGDLDSAQEHLGLISLNANSDISNDAFEKVVIIENNKSFTLALKEFALGEQFEKQKKITEALSKFLSVIHSAEGSDLAERSYIKIAKLNYNLSNFKECISVVDSMLTAYPKTIYADYAVLLKGNCYYVEQNKEAALKVYTEFLTSFPGSIYLDEVRHKIRILRNEKL